MAAVPSAGNKRKPEDAGPGSGSAASSGATSDDEIATSDSGDSCDSGGSSGSAGPPSILRRSRARRGGKRVRFAQVTVYYFARRQGFTCVPSAGGSSLGMAPRHHRARRYSLSQFAHLRQVSHRQHLRQHLRREKLRARRRELTQNGTVPSAEAAGLTLADVSDDDLDVGQVEVGDYFYLQPLPTKRRRALLRASGVRRIDAEERQELRALRLSREQCGCLCRLTCEPRTCACSQAGIQCQVDRTSFPCGCSRDGCGNVAGRIEFNPLRVRTHFLHTLMKLELENRREEEEEEEGAATLPAPTWPPTQPPETQDFQEYLAENERAVLHLQTAEELERLKAEEDSGSGSGGEGSGLCVLGEHLDDTWQVKPPPCPGLGSTILIPAQFPLESPVLCYPSGQAAQVGSQPYLADAPGLYCQVEPQAGAKGGGGHVEHPAPAPSPPVPAAVSKGGAPQNLPEHLEHPHLPI
ncbi:cysteine/serine-rich nuclear protein 2 [Taeniopygia guttata]|uniref:cysteine/serine-rich nuclear protein 2 n=1 Tax=Taeniopygia guttata TaxID=59729 RepID=UPI003BB8516B